MYELLPDPNVWAVCGRTAGEFRASLPSLSPAPQCLERIFCRCVYHVPHRPRTKKRSRSGNKLRRGSWHVAPSNGTILAVGVEVPTNSASEREGHRRRGIRDPSCQRFTCWRVTCSRTGISCIQWSDISMTSSSRTRGKTNENAINRPVGDVFRTPYLNCSGSWVAIEPVFYINTAGVSTGGPVSAVSRSDALI